MSVSTLLNTKWTIGTTIQMEQGGVSQEPLDVKFCSNEEVFESIFITQELESGVWVDKIYYENTLVFDNVSWVDSSYRTVSIYGGTDVEDPYLIDFFETSATQISTDTELVDSTILDDSLGAVANAIRTKSGGSSTLAFPSGFVSEIQNIPSGGTSDWEEVNLGGTGYALWDVYVIIDQNADQMGGTCSVTVGTQTKAQVGQGVSQIHFKNVPNGTTVSYTGDGDDFHYAWAKLDVYVSVNSSSGAQTGSTTASNGHNYSQGYMMLLISSPST